MNEQKPIGNQSTHEPPPFTQLYKDLGHFQASSPYGNNNDEITAIIQGEKHDVNHHVNCNINPQANTISLLSPLHRLAEVPNNANEGIKELCKEKLS
jgi:hypothetical protein